ncbi:MAG: hypothetical protein ACI9JN_001610 [Bacteroidia bacterium]|jgi:hypothetical protein
MSSTNQIFVVNADGYYFVVSGDVSVKPLHSNGCKTFPTLNSMLTYVMAKLKLSLDEVEGQEMFVELKDGQWDYCDSRGIWDECENIGQDGLTIEKWIALFEL